MQFMQGLQGFQGLQGNEEQQGSEDDKQGYTVADLRVCCSLINFYIKSSAS